MKYIIFGDEDADPVASGEPVLWSRTVPTGEETYLRESVIPLMLPLSEEGYRSGPARILNTAAHFSYVLDGSVVHWCIEWEPGLVVIRFAPDCLLAWARIRSPNPQFGGREATDAELENYDEDNEEQDCQYRLIFDAWDAQFDPNARKDWAVADDDTKHRFDAALAPVQGKAQAEAEFSASKEQVE